MVCINQNYWNMEAVVTMPLLLLPPPPPPPPPWSTMLPVPLGLKGLKVWTHSPYSLDLSPCNYILFAWVKKALQGCLFEYANAIKGVRASLHHKNIALLWLIIWLTDGRSALTLCSTRQIQVFVLCYVYSFIMPAKHINHIQETETLLILGRKT